MSLTQDATIIFAAMTYLEDDGCPVNITQVMDAYAANGSEHYNDEDVRSACSAMVSTLVPSDLKGIAPDLEKMARNLVQQILAGTGMRASLAAGNPNTAGSQSSANQGAAPLALLKIDPAYAPGLSVMISQATGGAVKDADTLASMFNTAISVAKDASTKISDAENKVKAALKEVAAATTPKGGTTVINASTLTYEVVMREAWDVMNLPAAKGPLSFEIPTLVWKDDQGNVVDHPLVPQIDEAYQYRPRALAKAMWAYKRGHNVFLTGHYGTGKTTFCEQIAAHIGMPCHRLNLDGYIERSEIIGRVDLVTDVSGNTVTQFTPGLLPSVMDTPCFVVFDEFDAGKPDALFSVQRALEKNGLLLMEDGGRLIKPHQLFRFWATANSKGHGDEYGIYPNVNVMSGATMDRFDTMIEVDYLEPKMEESLLRARFPSISDQAIKEAVAFAGYVRDAFKNGELSMTASPRGLFSFCQNFIDFKSTSKNDKNAQKMALEVSFLDKSPADTRARLEELAQRAFS